MTHRRKLFALLLVPFFAGFSMNLFKKKPEEQKVRLLAFPFTCSNNEIGNDITKGFVDNLDKKLEVLTRDNFDAYLSSYSIKIDSLLSATTSDFAAPASTASAIPPKYQNLVKDLFGREKTRSEFYKLTEVKYLAVGKAREKVLSELEQGNLVTAQNADLKVLDLETGEVIVDESFKQGMFEVVAPDRIGVKFASAANKVLRDIRKERERRQKYEQKKEEKQKVPYSY